MTEYIQGDLLNDSENDPGYTFRRDVPYSIMCKCEESKTEFPSFISLPIIGNNFDPTGFAKDSFKYHKDKLKMNGFDSENNTPVFFSYFEDEEVGDKALFPNDISLSFWKDRGGKLYACSTYNDFTIIGSFRNVRNSGGGVEPNITIFDYKVFDESNTYRDLNIEIVHRKGVDLETTLSMWIDSKGKDRNDIYNRLLDPMIFKGDFWNRQKFDTPLRRNPLLGLSHKAFGHYFSQPTIGDKYPDWRKWLGIKS